MSGYVYVLVSLKDNKRYIGSTIDLKSRLDEHNLGKVKSTKYRRPLELYRFQECNTIQEARYLENKYKKSRGSYEKAIKLSLLKIYGA